MARTTFGHSISIDILRQWAKLRNTVNPERRNWFPAFGITLAAIATVFVFARLWGRIRGKAGKFGLDDAVIIPAWIFGIATTVAFVLGTARYGFDGHVWDNAPGRATKTAFVGWISSSTFMASTCLTKVSILLFYRRMGAGSYNKVWLWTTWGCILFTLSYMTAFILAFILQCSPTESYWMSYDLSYTKPFKCRGEYVTGVMTGILGVVTDALAVIMPGILFYKLQMPTKEKIALWSIFGLGVVVVACGIGRTISLHSLLTGENFFDATWTSFEVFVWSQLESQLALICASAPAFKAFSVKYKNRSWGLSYFTRSSSSSRGNTGTGSLPSFSRPRKGFRLSKNVLNSLNSERDYEQLGPKEMQTITSSITPGYAPPEPTEHGRTSKLSDRVKEFSLSLLPWRRQSHDPTNHKQTAIPSPSSAIGLHDGRNSEGDTSLSILKTTTTSQRVSHTPISPPAPPFFPTERLSASSAGLITSSQRSPANASAAPNSEASPPSPTTMEMFNRYLDGKFGPPTPPKDARMIWPNRLDSSGLLASHHRRVLSAESHQHPSSSMTLARPIMKRSLSQDQIDSVSRQIEPLVSPLSPVRESAWMARPGTGNGRYG